jgi:DNA-binding GntR family transcriptional regulator
VSEQETLGATVYIQLRRDILAGLLGPGERLRADALRQRYDVGGSPVREALMRLEAEGFVRLEQNKGFRVAEISAALLHDLQASRIEIENVALRWSIERGGLEWEAGLLSAFHLLSSVRKFAEGVAEWNPGWLRYHHEFHRALVGGCNSPTILGIRQRLFDQAERYVALSISYRTEPRDDVGEHRSIMEAALARDVERALKCNREHIERTTEKLDRALSSTREPA